MLKEILKSVPDPRGKSGQDYRLWSLLSLIMLGFLCGRDSLAGVFRMGRAMPKRQLAKLGFYHGTPCLSTLTETMQLIDSEVLSALFLQAIVKKDGGFCHISMDGKTMRASKNGESKATHCVSAFCYELQQVIGQTASVGKGFEIPDALALLDKISLKNKVITGDALLSQKEICKKIIDGGGDYVFPVKDNQKSLKEEIVTAFEMPIFSLKNLRRTAAEKSWAD